MSLVDNGNSMVMPVAPMNETDNDRERMMIQSWMDDLA